eukprot:RCo009079
MTTAPAAPDSLAVVAKVQRVLEGFEYNPNGSTYNVDKKRPLSKMLETGQLISRTPSRPIQCVEGALVALHMTQRYLDIRRFGISMQSCESGTVWHHLVIGVYTGSKFGAFGISRNRRLMNKPLQFDTLRQLILDYKEAYEDCGHSLDYVTLSKAIPHHAFQEPTVVWHYVKIDMHDMDQIARICKAYTDRLLENTEKGWALGLVGVPLSSRRSRPAAMSLTQGSKSQWSPGGDVEVTSGDDTGGSFSEDERSSRTHRLASSLQSLPGAAARSRSLSHAPYCPHPSARDTRRTPAAGLGGKATTTTTTTTT